MPKVSVIVTTYNRKEYLSATIQAILNQTYQDFELIVVDNYSNYDFFSLIGKFDNNKIIPFQNSNNGVIAINRNFGIRKSSGEFIAFCDDDDIWVETKLYDQLRTITEKKCDLVYSNMYIFKNDIENVIGKTSSNGIKKMRNLISNNPINTSSVLVRNRHIFFPEDPCLIAIEDYALWINLFLRGFIFEIQKHPLIYFRISDENNSSKNADIKHLKIIYLYLSILILQPKLNIKFSIFYHIMINFVKFLIKNFLTKMDLIKSL